MPMTSFISVLWSPAPFTGWRGAALDGLRPWQPQQVSPRHKKIRQRTGDKQSIGIFEEPAVAGFHETEDALDNKKRMLTLRPHLRLGGVPGFLHRGQGVVTRALLVRKVTSSGRRSSDRLALSGMGAIAPYPRLRPVQEFGKDLRVVG